MTWFTGRFLATLLKDVKQEEHVFAGSDWTCWDMFHSQLCLGLPVYRVLE